jgi:heat shock protein HslJ
MMLLLCVLTVVAIGQAGGAAVGSAQRPAAESLEGTSWNAVELYGTVVPAASTESGRGPYLEFGTDGRLTGSDGCNRVMGSYAVKGDAIEFGPLAGTRMACPGTEEIVNRFHAALKGTGHWSIREGRLELFGASGKPLAVFARRPSGAR